MSSAPQTWRLRPGVHAVTVDEDLVLLDVAADAYVCLPNGAPAVRVADDSDLVDIPEPELARELLEARLVEQWAGRGPRVRRRPPPAAASALPWSYPPPRPTDAFEAAAALLGVAAHYRGRTLSEVMRHVGPSVGARTDSPPGPDVLRIVERFHRWIPYAPLSGKCLLRAFVLLRLLRRHGHDAAWVFGVATRPFRAHCWLQRGDVVLNDTVERARAYTPIMVA
jgi:hypothetical protein